MQFLTIFFIPTPTAATFFLADEFRSSFLVSEFLGIILNVENLKIPSAFKK